MRASRTKRVSRRRSRRRSRSRKSRSFRGTPPASPLREPEEEVTVIDGKTFVAQPFKGWDPTQGMARRNAGPLPVILDASPVILEASPVVSEPTQRFLPTDKQKKTLERIFKRKPYPDSATRNNLATEWGVSAKQIQTWFEKTRGRAKASRKQQEVDDEDDFAGRPAMEKASGEESGQSQVVRLKLKGESVDASRDCLPSQSSSSSDVRPITVHGAGASRDPLPDHNNPFTVPIPAPPPGPQTMTEAEERYAHGADSLLMKELRGKDLKRTLALVDEIKFRSHIRGISSSILQNKVTSIVQLFMVLEYSFSEGKRILMNTFLEKNEMVKTSARVQEILFKIINNNYSEDAVKFAKTHYIKKSLLDRVPKQRDEVTRLSLFEDDHFFSEIRNFRTLATKEQIELMVLFLLLLEHSFSIPKKEAVQSLLRTYEDVKNSATVQETLETMIRNKKSTEAVQFAKEFVKKESGLPVDRHPR